MVTANVHITDKSQVPRVLEALKMLGIYPHPSLGMEINTNWKDVYVNRNFCAPMPIGYEEEVYTDFHEDIEDFLEYVEQGQHYTLSDLEF